MYVLCISLSNHYLRCISKERLKSAFELESSYCLGF